MTVQPQPDPLPVAMQATDRSWMVTLTAVIVLGVLIIISFAFATERPITTLGVGFLLAGACVLAGALLGFLFGIPRALQRNDTPTTPEERAANARRESQYGVNTNLEQISDWLTKILVGVGLTQVGNLWDAAKTTAATFAPALGGGAGGTAVAIGILFYFPIAGFLFGYLWTRLFLAGALARADRSAAGFSAELAQIKLRVTAQEEQPQLDAAALSLVQQYLSQERNELLSPEKVKEAIAKASPSVKVQIFYQAQKVRRENWAEMQNKPVMERTIPVFEALTDDGKEVRFHKNYGQLGFALKDKRSPDYEKAIQALSKAIEYRGDWRQGWIIYEFNRAVCRICLDPNFPKKPSSAENRKRIVDDLRVAALATEIHSWFDMPPVDAWMKLNKLTLDSEEMELPE